MNVGREDGAWAREYERIAAMLRGAARVPWSAPRTWSQRRQAAREMIAALAESVRRARDERAREAWTAAMARADEFANAADRDEPSDLTTYR